MRKLLSPRRPSPSARLRLEVLEDRTTPTAAINLVAPSFDVPAGLSELVPLSLVSQPAGNAPVTYTAQSNNSQVTTQIITTPQTWVLSVTGVDGSGTPFS